MWFDDMILNKESFIGKVVVFQKGMADPNECGCYGDVGFKAKIVDIGVDMGCVYVKFSYEGFDEHNIPLEGRDYWDRNGVACLGPREAGVYTKEEKIYFEMEENTDKYFVFEDE